MSVTEASHAVSSRRDIQLEFDIELENLRDRTASFCGGRGLLNLCAVSAGRRYVCLELTLAQSEVLERDRARCLDGLGSNASFTKLRTQGHAEATGVRCCDQLLGVRARCVLEPGAEPECLALECAATNTKGAGAVFQTAIPSRFCSPQHRMF